MPYSLVDKYRRFRRICSLQLEDRDVVTHELSMGRRTQQSARLEPRNTDSKRATRFLKAWKNSLCCAESHDKCRST